jgi:hypothetical protein
MTGFAQLGTARIRAAQQAILWQQVLYKICADVQNGAGQN